MNNIISEEEFYKIYDKKIYNYNYYKKEKCKKYLNETDYIIIKIYEAQIEGKDIAPIKEQYQETLTQREAVRKEINELEESIQ